LLDHLAVEVQLLCTVKFDDFCHDDFRSLFWCLIVLLEHDLFGIMP